MIEPPTASFAFHTPSLSAPIIIRANTTSVNNSTAVDGNVISPPIGHDGTDFIYSNYDTYSGAY
jgi:hypothetical protein